MKFYLLSGKSKKENDTKYLEKVLLEKTLKECPTILYFANASLDSKDSLARFKEQMNGLFCKIIFYNDNIDLIDEVDILYFGGGITQKIVAELKNVYPKIITSDKIIAGSSAGANMWFIAGMGDYYSYTNNFQTRNYKMVNGYGVINATFCPHYQQEDLVIYNDVLREYNCDGFAVENDTALFIENDSFTVYKENKTNSVYWFKKSKNYEMIPLYEGTFYNLNGEDL